MKNLKGIRAIGLILLCIFLTSNLYAADDPWYMNQPIAEFVNNGLSHVKGTTIEDIEYKYKGKEFTLDLFNQLQADLYATNSFLFFLGDAKQKDDGSLSIVFDFTELPYITKVNLVGFEKMRESKIREKLTTKENSFALNQQIQLSQQAIIDLYKSEGYQDVTCESKEDDNESDNTCTITYTIKEGMQKRVNDVVFEGNNAFQSNVLKKQLQSKVSSYFTAGYYMEGNIEQDKQKIVTYYQNNGYVDAKVSEVRVETIPPEEGKEEKYIHLRLTYVIEEGELWKFGTITTEGNTVYSSDELQALVTMKQGEVFNMEKVSGIIEAINAKYWNNGYVHSTTEMQEKKNPGDKTISYVMKINENSQATISEIRVEGMTKTKEYVFMREMAFKVGDVFSREKFQKSAQNIYNTLIVTDVGMDLIDGKEPNTVIPIFKVTEGNQMTIQFGATFGGTVDSFPISGFVQWSDKNVGGTGRDLSISTTLSPDTQEFSMSFGDDWVKDKRWSNVVSFSFTRNSKTNGLQRGASSNYYTGHDTDSTYGQPYPAGYDSYLGYLAAGQANPASRYLMSYDYLRFALGYTSGYTFMFNAGSLSLSGGFSFGINRAYYNDSLYDPYEYLMKKYHERWQFANKFSFNISWDGRDLKENTTRGYIISNQFVYAGGILGGLSNYLKETLTASAYISPFKYKIAKKDAPVVIGVTSSVSWMLPQFWNNTDTYLGDGTTGWGWYGPKTGATRYEMLYIDGMNIGRGFDVIYDQSFLWNNELSIGAPIVVNVINWELFASATGIVSSYDGIVKNGFSSLNWYFALGAGIKLKIPGFPLGLYLVKNAKKLSGQDASWVGGSIFSNGSETSGMKLVLAITQTIY